MRRERRTHENSETNTKNILYIGGSILGIGIIAFIITFIVYGNKMDEQSQISASKIAELVQNTVVEEASTSMDKTVEEVEEQTQNEENNIITNTTLSNVAKNTTTNTSVSTNTTTTKENETSSINKTTSDNNLVEETTEENNTLQFEKPVDGEISKQYANESLLYSETLEEWTTHLGVDIKASKTTVVKAAEAGRVKSIKNDPRYGLSIIIEHQDGYETLYANLLTSEFVEVGEEVTKGQSIGTVGNTATFEILDEPHLHFEISKDGENLDPNQFIQW